MAYVNIYGIRPAHNWYILGICLGSETGGVGKV